MPPHPPRLILRLGKPVVFAACLLPLVWVIWLGWQNQLGANPVETLSHHTGDWSLRFLLLTLAVTPLRRLTGWNGLQRFRRMLGLFAFFYVCLHFGVYLIFDQFFDWRAIIADIAKRPYITVGFAGWLLLIPLAATSTGGMIKRLGRNWQRLHRLVYLIGVLGVLHYGWLVKADFTEPLVYGGVLATLLGYRLWWWRARSTTTNRPSPKRSTENPEGAENEFTQRRWPAPPAEIRAVTAYPDGPAPPHNFPDR